jgi:molybdopterin converting factor small subunit
LGSATLVSLNGCIVTAYDRAKALLKDGDEVRLLPMFDGG